jgi:hypothetical protein
MVTENSIRPNDRLSKMISVLFHPLLLPLYGLGILFTSPVILGFLPFSVKRLVLLIVLINNVLLPLSMMPLLRYKSIISTWSLEERKERYVPLIIVTIFYISTLFIIFRFPVPYVLKSFILSSLILSVIVTVITFWWKISIHSVGVGALTAMIFVLTFKTSLPLLGFVIPVVIIAGLVLSSRLRLNSHNPYQVWFGYLAGLLVMGSIMWVF